MLFLIIEKKKGGNIDGTDEFFEKFKNQVENVPQSELPNNAWNNFSNYREAVDIFINVGTQTTISTLKSILINAVASISIVCSSYLFMVEQESHQNIVNIQYHNQIKVLNLSNSIYYDFPRQDYLFSDKDHQQFNASKSGKIDSDIYNFPRQNYLSYYRFSDKYQKTDDEKLSETNQETDDDKLSETNQETDDDKLSKTNQETDDDKLSKTNQETDDDKLSEIDPSNQESGNEENVKDFNLLDSLERSKQPILNDSIDQIVDSLVAKNFKAKRYELAFVNNTLSLNFRKLRTKKERHFVDSFPIILPKSRSNLLEAIRPKTFFIGINAGRSTGILKRYELFKGQNWGLEIGTYFSRKFRLKFNISSIYFNYQLRSFNYFFDIDLDDLPQRPSNIFVDVQGRISYLFTQVDFIPISFKGISPFVGLGLGTNIDSRLILNYRYRLFNTIIKGNREGKFDFNPRYLGILNTGIDFNFSKRLNLNILISYTRDLTDNKFEQYIFTNLGFRYILGNVSSGLKDL